MRLLALAPNAWHGLWMNRQQLLSRLGRQHVVLYSTGSWFTWDRHDPAWRDAPLLGAFHAAENVWLDQPPRMLMRNPKVAAYDAMMLRLHAARWVRWLDRKAVGPLVVHVFHPAFAEYAKRIAADALVYHPYDLFEAMPGWNAKLETSEKFLLKNADLVIAVSDFLSSRLTEKGGREVRVLNNGVDLDAFLSPAGNHKQMPEDLARIPRPRIGYVGSFQPHVDLELIATLAQRRPEWNFVVIGGAISHRDQRTEREMSRCTELRNIHFLGHKERLQVPNYAANMDVNMIPWRLGEGKWVDAGYPSKLQEYLAAGSPVVSTDLQSVREFRDVIRIATGISDWESAIAEALETGGPGSREARREIARKNGWDQRASHLETWLRDLVSSPSQLRSHAA